MTRPTSICCGRRLRRIDIDAGRSHLTFSFCTACERMQWYRDDVPVEVDLVKDAASAAWNRQARAEAVAAP